MFRHHRTTIAGVVTGLAVIGMLTACAGTSSSDPTATRTVVATSSAAAPTPATSPSASAPAATASPSDGSTAGGSGTGSGTGSAGGRCTTASLAGSLEAGSGGAAGSTYIHIALRNTGTTTCTLQGWPGVSFVGSGSGAQIGAAASLDRASAHPVVTLAAGQTAVAPLQISQALNYDNATCEPRKPDGFRVYPPGSKQSLFIASTDHMACANSSVKVLTVQGLVPEGQAVD